MTEPRENQDGHTHVMRFGLGIDESRAYWANMEGRESAPSPQFAFEHHWFGTASESRVQTTLANMILRYDAYPEALRVLSRWRAMRPETRTVIVHWHMMLADPLYRFFAGTYLEERRQMFTPEVRRDVVVRWIEAQFPERWAIASKKRIATGLIGAARQAGLVEGSKDPRTLHYPRVPDDALGYGVRLFRSIDIEGSFLDNAYFRSVGLTGSFLFERLRKLPDVAVRTQGDLVEFESVTPDLTSWWEATAA